MAGTLLKIGQWRPSDDTLQPHPASPTGAVFNLNDGAIFSLQDSKGSGDGLVISPWTPTLFEAGNPHVIGAPVTSAAHTQSREVAMTLVWGTGSTYATWQANLHNLLTLLAGITPNQPAALLIQSPGASTPVYADVFAVKVVGVPIEELMTIQLTQDNIQLAFSIYPHLRGPMQTLSNLCVNPGFEAPSGPAVQVFNDPLTNLNAYAVTSSTYISTVTADSPTAFYHMNENVAANTMVDSAGTYNGSINLAGVTTGNPAFSNIASLGSYVFNGTSGNVDISYNAALNTSAWTVEAWVYPTGGAGTIRTILANGVSSNKGIDLFATSGNAFDVSIGTGSSAAAISGGTATLNAWSHVVATYNGTTLTLYVNGSSVNSTATAFSANTANDWWVGSTPGSAQFWPGNISAVAIYNTALSGTRVSAHYTAGANLIQQDSLTFADTLNIIVGSNNGFYFRLDETSGTVAYDVYGNGNGTYGAGVTHAATGLLNGDADKAITVAGTSTGNVTRGNANLSTSNASWSYGIWFQISANPGAVTMLSVGTNTTNQGCYISFNSSNQIQAGVIGTNILGSTVALNTPHFALLTWDGSNLKFYLDGAQVSTTANPGSLSMTLGTTAVYIGNFFGASGYFSGTLDEAFGEPFNMTSTHATNLYNAGNTAPSSTSNTMLIASGTTVACGSTAWNSRNQYFVRFRISAGATANFYVQVQDSNNYVGFQVSQTQLLLVNNIGGGGNVTQGSASVHVVPGIYYWLQATIFPGSSIVQTINVTLTGDANGATDSYVLGSITNNTATFPFTGNMRLGVSNGTLGIGGNYNNVHLVSLFGPGGWTFTPVGSAASGVGAWQAGQGVSGVGNPIVGTAVARIDAPPTLGLWGGAWYNYQSLSPAAQYLAPSGSGVTMGGAVWVKSSGLTNYATLSLDAYHYTSAGSFISATFGVGSLTGGATSWTQLSGTWTTPANTAFVVMRCVVDDYSASSWVIFDNVQCWNITSTGQSIMPYCDLRGLQGPYQWFVTGIQGDVAAPATVALGTYEASWAPNAVLNCYCGRRLFPSSGTTLVSQYTPTVSGMTPTLASSAYGGYTIAVTTNPSFNLAVQGMPTNVKQLQGTFRLLQRMQTSQSTGNIANCTGYADAQEQNFYSFGGTAQTFLSDVASPAVQPFTAGSTWTTTDWSTLAFPLTQLSASRDLTTVTPLLSSDYTDTTGGGSTLTANWTAFIPTDTETLVVQATNGSTGVTYTTSWLWLYADGMWPQQAAWLFSGEAIAVPNATHAIGGFGSNGAGLRSVADSYMQLDPTQTISGTSVNQGVALITDASATVLPTYLEFRYSPRYLYPD